MECTAWSSNIAADITRHMCLSKHVLADLVSRHHKTTQKLWLPQDKTTACGQYCGIGSGQPMDAISRHSLSMECATKHACRGIWVSCSYCLVAGKYQVVLKRATIFRCHTYPRTMELSPLLVKLGSTC